MNIVLVGPAWPFRGGIAETTNALYKTFLERGHNAHVVGFKKQFPKLLFPGQTQFDSSREDNLPSERTLIPWNPFTWPATARAIRRHNPDLIIYKWWIPFMGPAFWGVSKLLGGSYRNRTAFACHNVLPHEKRAGDMLFTKMALGSGSFIMTFSKAEAETGRKLFPDRARESIRATPLPVYECYDEFTEGAQAARAKLGIDAKKLLLFIGLIREYKGVDVLLRAMPAIIQRDPEIKLVIAGEFYEGQEKYESLIDDLKIRDHVIVRPKFVPSHEIGLYLAAADLNVLPYRHATQSGILVTAYAHGCPVLVTRVGGLAEVVDDGKSGFVVEGENPQAIADAVMNYYNTGGRDTYEPHVRAKSEEFSWHRPCELLEAFARSAPSRP
ncbi:MAG: glycosyltransferase family 4 protein [bacterium]|nr:glycosyltransferase family 4 protein [bacterium]